MGAEYAVIFEDDATLVKDGKRLLGNIPGGEQGSFLGAVNTLIAKAPAGWHEINLGRCDAECHRQTLRGKLSDSAFFYQSRYAYCSRPRLRPERLVP